MFAQCSIVAMLQSTQGRELLGQQKEDYCLLRSATGTDACLYQVVAAEAQKIHR